MFTKFNSTVASKALAAVMFATVCFGSTTLVGCGGSGMSNESNIPAEPMIAKDDTASRESAATETKQPGEDNGEEDSGAPDSRESGIVVDEDQATKGGPSSYWHGVSNLGVNNDMIWTYVNGSGVCNWMQWRSRAGAGKYNVSVFIPRAYGTSRSAKYRVQSINSGGTSEVATVRVDQYSIYDKWVSLGTYTFAGEPAVYLGDDSDESYSTRRMLAFDAVKFEAVSTGGGGGGGGATVPAFYQGASAWGGMKMRPSNYLMKDYGCLVTSQAAVANWAGFSTDPGKYCTWLGSHGGFNTGGYLTSNSKLGEYTGGRARITAAYNWRTTPADMGRIKSELDARRPVILEVRYRQSDSSSYMHFVVATGYSTSGGQISDITIMDPMSSGGQLISIKKYVYHTSIARWIYGAKTVARS